MSHIIDSVGNTPLIQIPYEKNKKVHIYAKCEWFNPSGSVKDRAASILVSTISYPIHLMHAIARDVF